MTRYHIPTTRLAILMAALVPALSSAGGLPLGTLIHDGPATPEQLSLYLPLTAALPTTARASVQYRVEGAPTWREGHPLHRIRPDFAQTPGAGSVPDAFAWPLIDLVPGMRYEVEVTVTSGAESDVRSGLFTTRSLPQRRARPTSSSPAVPVWPPSRPR